jgi:hypothetical protein
MQTRESARYKPLSGWLIITTLVVFVATLSFCFFMFFLPAWVVEGFWWSFQAIGQLAALGLFIYWWRSGTISGPRNRETARDGGMSVWRVLMTLTAVIITFGLCFFIRFRLPRWAVESLGSWFDMSGLALGLGLFIYWWSNNISKKP